MATFEIQGPDGKTYQVEAADMQSAVAALNGFAQPTGGASVNQDNLARNIAGGNQMLDTALDGVVGLRNGITLGAADELVDGGLKGVLLGQMPGQGNFNYDVPMGDRYRANRDAGREMLSASREASPIATGAGDIVGAIGPSLAGGPVVAGAKTTGQTVARLMGFGGAEGALIGAGNSDGGDLVGDTARGAGLGAAFGAAAKPIANGIQMLGRSVSAPIAGAVDAITGRASPRRANNVMNRVVSRAGVGIDDLQQMALDAGRAGQPEFVLADMLGPSGQRALSGVARTPGEGAQDIHQFLQSRQLNAGDRMSMALADGLGAPDTAAQRQTALRDIRSADAATNYSAAREGATPVDVRGALGVLDTRLAQTEGMEGTGFTGDGIDAVFARFRNRLAADRVPADVDAIELSDFDRVLGVKQDMQDAAEAAARQGRGNEAREINRVIAELDAALEASSPNYRTANDTFRDQSRTIDAVDTGVVSARPSTRPADVIEGFRGMTPDQQNAFRAGLADRLIGKVEGQAPGANVASPLMRNRTDEILGEVAHDPDLLRGQITRENTMAETRQRAIGGSRTADNLADMDDVQPFDVGLMANLLGGNYATAATQAGQKGVNVLTGQNEATQQLIARMLLSNNPREALAPMLRQEASSANFNALLQAALRQAGHQALTR